MTSSSWLVDLIDAIGEKTALVDHLEKKLLSGNYDPHALKTLIADTLGLRRSQMKVLLKNAEDPNPDYWCDFKHAVKAYTKDVEVWEANLDDESFANMEKSAGILAGVTSLFLGMEFATCAACLWDRMLVNQLMDKNKEENNGSRSN